MRAREKPPWILFWAPLGLLAIAALWLCIYLHDVELEYWIPRGPNARERGLPLVGPSVVELPNNPFLMSACLNIDARGSIRGWASQVVVSTADSMDPILELLRERTGLESRKSSTGSFMPENPGVILAHRAAPYGAIRRCLLSFNEPGIGLWRLRFGVLRWEDPWDALHAGEYRWPRNESPHAFAPHQPFLGMIGVDQVSIRTGERLSASAPHLYVKQLEGQTLWSLGSAKGADAPGLARVLEGIEEPMLRLSVSPDVPWGALVDLLIDGQLLGRVQFDLD